jgi:DNA modification methylase
MNDPQPWTLMHGDCRDRLAELADNSIDSVVTDPPYELGFMGKQWDNAGVAYDPALWAEVLRVLKPGGHLLAFGGTRTYHRMACAIEDAGFEVRDSIHWVYGSGFPKSHNVSKAIDKAAGAEREMVGYDATRARPNKANYAKRTDRQPSAGAVEGWKDNGATITAPATDAARQWDGWGTALKPAHEPIVVARKPLAGTVAANVLEYGTGALNIDGCRVGNEVRHNPACRTPDGSPSLGNGWTATEGTTATGRWPANFVLTHAADCEPIGTTTERVGGGANATSGFVEGYERGDGFVGRDVSAAVWRCAPGCPVAALDEQSGYLHGSGNKQDVERGTGTDYDATSFHVSYAARAHRDHGSAGGGASRFFTITEWDDIADAVPFRYQAKASKKERNAGLDAIEGKQIGAKGNGLARTCDTCGASVIDGCDCPDRTFSNPVRKNHHPTVKPVALMRWLVRLVTPPGGVVLDPFAGSGTTMVAAITEGFHPVGIEMTDDYLPIIEGRCQWAVEQSSLDYATPLDADTPNSGADTQTDNPPTEPTLFD